MRSEIDIFAWLFGATLYFGPILRDLLVVLAVWFLLAAFGVSRKYFLCYSIAMLLQIFLPTFTSLLPLRSLNAMLGKETAPLVFLIYNELQTILVNTLGSFALLFIALKIWLRNRQSAKLRAG
jgi:hypothetical protein